MNCELTDLPTEMCAHCRGLDTTEPHGAYAISWQGPARYPGKLACGHWVAEGDTIGRIKDASWDDGGEFVCERCFLDGIQ